MALSSHRIVDEILIVVIWVPTVLILHLSLLILPIFHKILVHVDVVVIMCVIPIGIIVMIRALLISRF